MLQRTARRYLPHSSVGKRLFTITSGLGTIPTSSIAVSTSTTTTQTNEKAIQISNSAEEWHTRNGQQGGRTRSGSTSSGHGGRGRRPARGGQNLSARYVRLENAIRGKQARTEAQAANLSGPGAAASVGTATSATTTARGEAPSAPVPTTSTSTGSVRMARGKSVEMFRGLVVPEEPKPPADDECCMSGCAVCVYDLHEEELEAYQTALSTLRASLVALGVPQAEWPARVRPASASLSSSTASSSQPPGAQAPAETEKSRKGAVLSAFEEMERRLAEKHRAEASRAEHDREPGGDADSDAGTPGSVPQSQAQTAASLCSTDSELDVMPHWRERQQLAAQTQKAARRQAFWTELYEGVRWVLFSNR